MQDLKHSVTFSLKHVGINCQNEEEALKTAEKFEGAFGLPVKAGNSSVFAGGAIECMKKPYLGLNGHIAFETASIEEAILYLKEKGFEVDPDTAKYNEEGICKAVYLQGDFGGFAVHLIKK